MIETRDPLNFVGRCRRQISTITQQPHLSITRQETAHGDRYIFSVNSASLTEAEGRIYIVIPFCSLGSQKYWLATSMEFTSGRISRLSSISLVLFAGDATEERKIVLLRAEWDSLDGDSPHAQPHWHVYQNRINTLNGQVENIANKLTFGHAPNWDRCEEFHFAMSAQWPFNGINSHILDMEEDGVLGWLEGCLKYIKQELSYLAERKKRVIAPE